MNDDYKILNTGTQLPPIGFGTWEINPDSAAEAVVLQALQTGYRLIDTAKIYGNEKGVGAALRNCGIARDELRITTKLWNDDQGYEQTLGGLQASLDRLGLDFLDLYLINWPATSHRHESWRAFEKIYTDGLARAVGVSNYTVVHLQQLMERSQLVPAVNQVEFHPFIYEQQQALLTFCKQHAIAVEAYSPLSRVSQEDNPVIEAVARDLGRSSQQIVLRWCVQHGTIPLPRSTSSEHIANNLNIFDFELSDEDMAKLNNLSDGERVTWDPASMKN